MDKRERNVKDEITLFKYSNNIVKKKCIRKNSRITCTRERG